MDLYIAFKEQNFLHFQELKYLNFDKQNNVNDKTDEFIIADNVEELNMLLIFVYAQEYTRIITFVVNTNVSMH